MGNPANVSQPDKHGTIKTGGIHLAIATDVVLRLLSAQGDGEFCVSDPRAVPGHRRHPHGDAFHRLAGVGRIRLAVRHLLPGAIPATMVTASLDVGNLVVTLAGLSFLGLGAPAPAPELGAMAARGLQFLLQQWWIPVMPGIGVALLALAANLSGDAVADATGLGV